MSEPISYSLEAFHSTISVMLVDKVLTREEKRLIIKLASALGLSEEEPSQVYQAIRNGEETKGCTPIDEDLAHEIYTKVFEIAIVNASLSRDEFRVLAHLRDIFQIDDKEHQRIYFVRHKEENWLMLGYTNDLERRLKEEERHLGDG